MAVTLGSEEKKTITSEPTNSQRPWVIAWCHTGDSGGSKRAALEMVRELARRGHVIDEYIIRIGEPNLSHWPLRAYVRESYQYLLPQTGNALRPYLIQVWVSLFQDIWKMKSLTATLEIVSEDIQSRAYDFVHIDHCSPSYTVSLTTMLTQPTVVYSHEVSGVRYEGNRSSGSQAGHSGFRRIYEVGCELATSTWSKIRRLKDLGGLSGAGVVLTNSCYSKETMFQRTGRSCSVCRYGVDPATFRPLGLTVEPMVLSAGRIVEAKQHHLVIEAVAKIPKFRRPRVVIATPESLTKQENPLYLARITEMAGSAEVALEIRRNPTEDELVVLYNQALVLVFVPIMEPFGLVALEAMVCGTPVIGVREAGVRESVIDEQSGILVDRDSTELAGAIDRLVQNSDLRSRLGQQAAVYVRREWTWARSIDCYEIEIRKLLNGRTIAKTSGNPTKVGMER